MKLYQLYLIKYQIVSKFEVYDVYWLCSMYNVIIVLIRYENVVRYL